MVAHHKKSPTTNGARCDFCGRTSPIPEGWLPSPCRYCDRLYFPAASRARLAATIVGLVSLALLTVFAWMAVF